MKKTLSILFSCMLFLAYSQKKEDNKEDTIVAENYRTLEYRERNYKPTIKNHKTVKYNSYKGHKNTKTSNKNLSVVKFKTTNSKKRASYNSSSSYKHSYSSGICGALTKKGGTCSRRVSGGGRCWQH